MDTSRRGLPCWAIAVLVAVGGAVQSEGVTWRRSCGETREELRPQEREELRPQGGWTDVDDVFRCSAEDYEAMAQTWVPGLQAEPAAGSRTVGGLLSTSANYIDRAVRPVHIFFETFGKTTLTGAYNLMKQLAKTPHVKVTFVGPVGKLIQKKDPATGERVIVYADQLLPAASNDVKGDLPDPALEGDKTYLAKQLRKYDRLQHNGTVWTERKSENVTVLWDFAVSESEMKSLGAAGVEFVPCRPRRYFWSVKSNTAVRQMLPRLFLTDGGENPEGSTWVFREQDNRDWPRQFYALQTCLGLEDVMLLLHDTEGLAWKP
ncbi:unnamed protein product [Amoebophrya sp. A120]|nr:unnamed protein product [Amoebophrya sp. A120]|eukprot:GSA120T00023851001.1